MTIDFLTEQRRQHEEAERQARQIRESDRTAQDSLKRQTLAEADRHRRLRRIAETKGLGLHSKAEIENAEHMTEGALGTLSYGDDLPAKDLTRTEERKTLLG